MLLTLLVGHLFKLQPDMERLKFLKTSLRLATKYHHTETAKALLLILANKLTTSSAPDLILNTLTK